MGSRYVETFLEMMAAERGAAANTLDAYRRDLDDFAEFIDGADHEADTDDLRDYIGAMKQRGLAARTAARRLSTLRQFHKFLFVEGIRSDDPSSLIDSPRLGRPLPKYLSETEVDALLKAAQAHGPRTEAMLEILYAAGLRVAAEDLRLGETVMLALASLGDPGPAHADPTELFRVVGALRLIGLDADARALAVEAAIANGV